MSLPDAALARRQVQARPRLLLELERLVVVLDALVELAGHVGREAGARLLEGVDVVPAGDLPRAPRLLGRRLVLLHHLGVLLRGAAGAGAGAAAAAGRGGLLRGVGGLLARRGGVRDELLARRPTGS